MKKDIILFSAIFLILSFIVSGTYAYFQWVNAEDTTVVFNVPGDIEDYIYYDAGESHFVGNFQPSSNVCGGQSNTVSFYIKNGAPINEEEHGKLYVTLMMDINNIDPDIAASSAVKWSVTQGDASNCDTLLASGNFSGKTTGDSFSLLESVMLNQSACVNGNTISSNCKYTVWVWIDENTTANLNLLSGKTIDVNIWSQIDMGFVQKTAGLYASDGSFTSWDTLITNKDITVSNGVITDSERNTYDENGSVIEYSDLIGELVIPNTITVIGGAAFESSNITSIVIPDSVTSIEGYAFQLSKLKNVVIGNSVTSIGDFAFSVTPLESVVLPDSVTTIGSNAFEYTHLTSVAIPKLVTSIGSYVFAGSSLTSVVIPKSVTSIGEGAFYETPLTDVYYEGTEAEWNAINIQNTQGYNNILINATKHYSYKG